jgi:hypothetical protein
MSTNIPKGEALIPGRSRDNARAALDAAKAAGLEPYVVKTVQEGYLVPEAVVEHYKAPEGSAEPEVAEADPDAPNGGEAGEAIDGENAGETQPTDPQETESELKAPAKSASKGDWVDYAVAASKDTDSPLSEEEANALTQAQLIERFGA